MNIFLLSLVSQDELPDRETVLISTIPFATFDGANGAATELVRECLTDDEAPVELAVTLDWVINPGYKFSEVIQAWTTDAGGHTFLIREMPLVETGAVDFRLLKTPVPWLFYGLGLLIGCLTNHALALGLMSLAFALMLQLVSWRRTGR